MPSGQTPATTTGQTLCPVALFRIEPSLFTEDGGLLYGEGYYDYASDAKACLSPSLLALLPSPYLFRNGPPPPRLSVRMGLR